MWILFFPASVGACPVCFGEENSSMTEGIRVAILTLMGVTGTVFAGIVTFALYMRKRSKLTLDGTVSPPSPNGKGGY